MKKRILALVLSVAMVLGAVSFTAFADTSTNPYESGKNDTAQYLMKLPEAEALSTDYQWTSGDGTVPMRVENGERFLVYQNLGRQDQINTSIYNSKFTYGQDKGIPEAVTFADDFSTMWIAVRIKINDFGDAFEKTSSALRFYVKNPDSTLLLGSSSSKPAKFLDLNDGSMTWFYGWSGVGTSGVAEIEFTGDVDGYIMFPIANNADVTAESLRENFEGFSIRFYNGTASTSNKQIKNSSWADKEFLLGDSFLVSDAAAFQSARIAERSITKYAPNGYEDTAYYAVRIGGYRTLYYNSGASFVSKSQYDPTASGTGLNSRYIAHITTLPNGDRAIEYIVNEGATYSVSESSGNYINVPVFDTYEHLRTGADYRNQEGKGVPAEIDVSKMKTLAFRIATKDGTVQNEAIAFRLNVGLANSNKNYSDSYALAANYPVTYIDANTGIAQNITTDDKGFFNFTNDIDGYLLVDMEGFFGTSVTADRIQAEWGCYPQYTRSATRIQLKSGFENGKALYYGDVLFVEDAEKFKEYHCPHTSWTTGTVVAPTCQAGGYTPYTCNGCGKTENRDVTTAIECDKNVDVPEVKATCKAAGTTAGKKCSMCGAVTEGCTVIAILEHDKLGGDLPAKEATCKEAGYSAAKTCSMCGEISEQSATIDPIACDKNVDVPEVKATCKAAGATAGKKCSMCGEVQEGCTVINPIACDNKGGDVAGKDATCKEAGVEAAKKCSMCGEISEGGAVINPIACDKNVDVPEVKATCKAAGTAAGKKCSMCGEVQEGCTVINPIACDNKGGDVAGKDATCKEAGVEAAKKCSMCGEISEGGAVINPIACDKNVDVPAVDATCKAAGTTAGKKCSMCGEVQEGCEAVAVLEHKMALKETVDPTATEKGYDLYECSECGETEKKNYVDELGEESNKGEAEVEGEVDAPDAGDNLMVVMIFTIVALGAAAVLFATKKRARR